MLNSASSPPEAQASFPARLRSPVWIRARARRALPVCSLLVVVLLVVRAVLGDRAGFTRSLRLLEHPVPWWVVCAIGAEALSYLAYATAQQRLATRRCVERTTRRPGRGRVPPPA